MTQFPAISESAISDQRSAISDYLIPFLVGGVLLAAALLKIQHIWTDPSRFPPTSGWTWFQVILVESELTCCLSLWFGLWPRLTRWAAMLMFACFLGYAISQAIAGVQSCACFGKVEFHPWLAALIDAGLLLRLCVGNLRDGKACGLPGC